MAHHKLSEGCIETIMTGGHYEKPILQMIGFKKIPSNSSEDRYRLLLSDGKYIITYAILSTQHNDKLVTGELTDLSIIQVDNFVTTHCNTNGKDKRVLVIVELRVLTPGTQLGKKIGNPQHWKDDGTNSTAQTTTAPAAYTKPSPVRQPAPMAGLDTSTLSAQMTHPIASLSPYQNKWVILARVMSKTPIRTWSNAKGEGKLFSMDLCDESGEIRATAFKNECDKFYDLIQVDKVYYISRCQLKTANKQYTSLKNDYEMTFTAETVVVECTEDSGSMPTVKFDFVPISKIADKPQDSLIDLIGVCKSVSDLQELTARSTGKLLKKRELMLVDTSGVAVTLTLWGNEAETFDGSTNPVIAIKGGRIAEFNGGKSVSCLSSTMVRLNPDLPEAHRLRGWYDNGGDAAEATNISARSGVAAGGSSEWLTFSEAEARRLGTGERGDYFNLVGVLTYTYADGAAYKACPKEGCNKKLVDQENGLFRCEKCNRDYPNYKYRLLLGASVSDPTGDQRVTAFNEAAEAMLGAPAADVGRMAEYDKRAYAQLFDDVKFRTFLFKFRTKMETYSDESRLKTVVMNALPIDYKDANNRLIKSIKTLTGVEV